MNKSLRLLALWAALLICVSLYSQDKKTEYPDILKALEESGDYAPMFPFQPTHDAPRNITNVAYWPDSDHNPAGNSGMIVSRGENF